MKALEESIEQRRNETRESLVMFGPDEDVVEVTRRIKEELQALDKVAAAAGEPVIDAEFVALVMAMDLDEGYYNCRVRPDQIWLLAFTFAGFIFIPMVLAMGLSSAPLIFTIFMYYVIKRIAI